MNNDLFNIFQDLERQTSKKGRDSKIIRAPFGYPGGKKQSVKYILPHLPYYNTYVEPFGGSGVVLINREKSPLEIFNDRYAGVVAFYRCIRNKEKMRKLIERLDLTVHSREEFVWCKQTWKDVNSDVERAARWYYMSMYSFASKGKHFGRTLKGKSNMSGKIRNTIKRFPEIHERFTKVQIENQDWYDCIIDYDSPDTVFYLDPPYIDAYKSTYIHELSIDEYHKLLDIIFECKGFVALSGYSNPIYENRDWDARYEWESFVSMRGASYDALTGHQDMENIDPGRDKATEVLWIKEAKE